MLTELRKDLDSTFKRISTIKTKIISQYPDFQKSINQLLSLDNYKWILNVAYELIIYRYFRRKAKRIGTKAS